jgi:protein-S-isoprenylcysteine O-methyltransferase Ste14
MRNPIRLKNLSRRFAPYYVLGLAALFLSQPSWRAFAVGLVPIVLGVGFRTWGTGHLIKNDRFTVTGPYAHVRHPLYLGTILVAAGFAIMLGGFATLIVLVCVVPWFGLIYFPRKERVESERLVERYGEAFERYREAVPALLPSLRRFALEPATGAPSVRWSAACYDANNEQGTLLAICAGVACIVVRIAWLRRRPIPARCPRATERLRPPARPSWIACVLDVGAAPQTPWSRR